MILYQFLQLSGNILKNIANNPLKMFLLLCPKFHPPLDEIVYHMTIRIQQEI